MAARYRKVAERPVYARPLLQVAAGTFEAPGGEHLNGSRCTIGARWR